MEKYIDKVKAYASQFGFHDVYYQGKENGKEIYFLFDKSLDGKKTGWPKFVTVTEDGKIEPVTDIPTINRYMRL